MILDIIIIISVVLFGFFIPNIFKIDKNEQRHLLLLWIYHLVFAIAYYFFTIDDISSDSQRYWNVAKEMTGDEAYASLFIGRGTHVMFGLNYFISGVLDLYYLTGTIMYSLLGYIGLVLFYQITITLVPYNSKFFSFNLFPLLFFLPNLHFWSVGIGKDTILFFCIAIFSYSLLRLKKRIFWILVSLILSYFVRPHITLFLLLSFSLAYLFNNKVPKYQRVFLFVCLLGGGLILLPKVMEYAKIEELSVEGYSQFAETKAEQLNQAHTGSGVDVSSYPLPLRILTFLFRPTFIDINGLPALLAAFENLFLLILTIRVLINKPIATFKKSPLIIQGLLILLVIGTLTFSSSLGNLGIMLRMRNMLLPGMLIFFFWSFSYQKQIRHRKIET